MNNRNPAIKRLTKECQEIEKEQNNEHFRAYPLDGDLFEWHFIIAGPVDTPYADGLYHGRLLLPPDYPFKPPSVIFMTPNGRFQTGVKICLSITGYHPEYWQPAWGIRTGLMAIISMLPQKDPSSIGSITCSDSDIRIFASRSREYICPNCFDSNRSIWAGSLPACSIDSPIMTGDSAALYAQNHPVLKLDEPASNSNRLATRIPMLWAAIMMSLIIIFALYYQHVG